MQMDLNSLIQLLIRQITVLKVRFVVPAPIFVPEAPMFLLSLSHEVVDVVVCAITQHLQKAELFLSASVWLDLETLGAIYHIFSHAHFQAVLNYMIVESPSIEICLTSKLIPDKFLDFNDFFLVRILLDLLVDLLVVGFDVEQHLLIARVHIEFEQVTTHELVDVSFVAFDFILYPDNLRVSVSIEPLPQFVNFFDPNLMSLVSLD